MKDSLAAALQQTAQTTYDRRTALDKKNAAVTLARQKAESVMGREGGEEEEEREEGEEEVEVGGEKEGEKLHAGQFVGLVETGSTLNAPRVLIRRVHAFLPRKQDSLLWYKDQGRSSYGLYLDGKQWIEDINSLIPVKVQLVVRKQAKESAYHLCTSVRTIHKAVHGHSSKS